MNLTPKNSWYIGARSDELKIKATLARTIINQNLVLYRGEDGTAKTLVDRCPHKGVPLSLGRVEGNQISCRYHGWAFDGEGELKNIPCHGLNEKLMKCRVQNFTTVEQDDWIWVWMGEDTPLEGPPKYPKTQGYYWFELHNVMEAPVDLILENGLDCSHTGFVHEGFFRSKPEQFIEAVIEKTPRGVRVQTLGEKAHHKRDVRSLLSGGNEITHFDEFLAPHTVKVDYNMGRSHVITILICTPETEGRTRVYTRMASRFPYFNYVIGKFIEKTTVKVVAQDKEVLEGQAKNIKFRERNGFRLSTADAPTRTFFQAFDQVCEGERLWAGEYGSKTVSYKL